MPEVVPTGHAKREDEEGDREGCPFFMTGGRGSCLRMFLMPLGFLGFDWWIFSFPIYSRRTFLLFYSTLFYFYLFIYLFFLFCCLLLIFYSS